MPPDPAPLERVHITVCICTYRRPALLARLLDEVGSQATHEAFSFSIVVADNDAAGSGHAVVLAFANRSSVPIVYCRENRQNIALARNCALRHAIGDFVAWIDDDEFPEPEWLFHLFATASRFNAAGALGPVRPYFDAPPPPWLLAGRFCERREHLTGTRVHWSQSFAGNALIRLKVLRGLPIAFRPDFGMAGEDVDLFRRLAAEGHRFVWCNEAVAYENVPPSRCKRRYRLKRAMLHGQNSIHFVSRVDLIKSFLALPLYSALLPMTLFLGHHVFMKYILKLTGHTGRLLALLGAPVIRHRPS